MVTTGSRCHRPGTQVIPQQKIRLHPLATRTVGLLLGILVLCSGCKRFQPPETRFIGSWRVDAAETLTRSQRVQTLSRMNRYHLGQMVTPDLKKIRYNFTEQGRLMFGDGSTLKPLADYTVNRVSPSYVNLTLAYRSLRNGETEKAQIVYQGDSIVFSRGRHNVVLVPE